MTQIDEFESIFKAAAKSPFVMQPVTLSRTLVVTDFDENVDTGYLDRIRNFLAALDQIEKPVAYEFVHRRDYQKVDDLLTHVAQFKPDFICTYRNLGVAAIDYPYSLGVFVDVLTQATSIPVLLLPRPEKLRENPELMSNTDRVMAATDHLTTESRLISIAARFTQHDGTLTLVHVEDEISLNRVFAAIEKIPEIDTDIACEKIRDQLLREPADYIQSCREGIREAGIPINVDSVITVGHHISDYRQMLAERRVDLLVINTKDEDQLAMHGMAYPLSIELRDTPILML
jgi:hypothetical protein